MPILKFRLVWWCSFNRFDVFNLVCFLPEAKVSKNQGFLCFFMIFFDNKGLFKEAPPAVHGSHICKLLGCSPTKLVFFFQLSENIGS